MDIQTADATVRSGIVIEPEVAAAGALHQA